MVYMMKMFGMLLMWGCCSNKWSRVLFFLYWWSMLWVVILINRWGSGRCWSRGLRGIWMSRRVGGSWMCFLMWMLWWICMMGGVWRWRGWGRSWVRRSWGSLRRRGGWGRRRRGGFGWGIRLGVGVFVWWVFDFGLGILVGVGW